MNVRLLGNMLAMAAVVASLAVTAGCGSKNPAKDAEQAEAPIDADPLALLPGSVVALVNVDARAVYDSGSVGGQLAQLSEQLLPIGQEAGFVPSRDVDRVTIGSYSTQGVDVAAVIRGRFDPAKIEQAAKGGVATKAGVPIVGSPYAGRTLYTVSNVGFVVLTDKTVIAGSETGIRRALDRLRDGRVKRDFAPWIIQTVETPGAAVAAAVDFANQPVANAAVGAMPLPWLQGLRAARVLGNFQPPGMNVAGSLTYGDEKQATAGAAGLKSIVSIANLLAVTGVAPKISNLQATVAQSDVQYQFALDDQSLRTFLNTAPRALGK